MTPIRRIIQITPISCHLLILLSYFFDCFSKPRSPKSSSQFRLLTPLFLLERRQELCPHCSFPLPAMTLPWLYSSFTYTPRGRILGLLLAWELPFVGPPKGSRKRGLCTLKASAVGCTTSFFQFSLASTLPMSLASQWRMVHLLEGWAN